LVVYVAHEPMHDVAADADPAALMTVKPAIVRAAMEVAAMRRFSLDMILLG
jgi:hypothetical protein